MKRERIEGDRYYTPAGLGDQLVELLPIGPMDLVLEPHVGGGAFAKACIEQGKGWVHVMDIDPDAPGLALAHAYSPGVDFLEWQPLTDAERADKVRARMLPTVAEMAPTWILGNPPYTDLLAHLQHAMDTTERHVAFLVRLAAVSSKARADFWDRWGGHVRGFWVLASRPRFRADSTGSGKYDYAFIWLDKQHQGPPEHFVPGWRWTFGPRAK